MRKLTKEEAEKIEWQMDGRKCYARAVLMEMGIGDIILLEQKDWNQKTRKPSTYCLMLGRKAGRQWTCRTLKDGSGWMIERMG